MAHLNLQKISVSCKNREKEEQKRNIRKRNLLVLIHHYLEEYGLLQCADALKSSLNFPIDDFAVCDNINLELILQDFESYYFLKYEKFPQLIKKSAEDKEGKKINNIAKSQKFKKLQKMPQSDQRASSLEECINLTNICNAKDTLKAEQGVAKSVKILDPLERFENYDSDWKSMANIIMQDVGVPKHIDWNDVIGHSHAKQLLKEAIVYPIKYNQLFSSVFSPWKSVLLYGPTGTGKSLLAAAAASNSQATFFKISVSTLLSKWRGESEKLIKVLFDLAKYYAPSVIFIDEIDALMSHRGCDHEASRRMKTELFLSMDSISSNEKQILLLAATNLPWELDHAMLRRLEKRVFISPPNEESRILLFKKFLPPNIEITKNVAIKTNLDYKILADTTTNYSAADIEIVSKETKMSCIRHVLCLLEKDEEMAIPKKIAMHPIETSDILQAINKTKPAASDLLNKYMEWRNQHGSE
ncbi:katanin p60 ATPase-containing subunit A-like 2 [Uloborus diversus]|uniref:katanin p60 ATPase-containing subunit A-like 2 n=1 Tax=Uloborus diversus TaxID=327109 RepID=UPI0024094C84|nr:katanin p60 ATPase-containing subunit A-like 2 [Uloborus diversus]